MEPFAGHTIPELVNSGKIDVLLGSDNYNLMYPKNEVIGGVGEPYACARLCPLGWCTVGRIIWRAQEQITTPVCVILFACSSLVRLYQ